MRIYSSRHAQGVIEYLLLVTAVIVVLIIGVLHKGGAFVRGTEAVLGLSGSVLDQHRSQMNFTTTP